MTKVIGLAGRIGSGKGTAAEHLKSEYGAEQFVYSDILADVLERLYLPATRDNLQHLGKALREGLGESVLVDAMKGDIEKGSADVRLIDGIRYVNEVEMLREFPGSRLIFIDAPLEVRHERVKERAQKGEGSMTLDEFRKKERAETERELDRVKRMADHVVDNTGTIEELHQTIDSLMNG